MFTYEILYFGGWAADLNLTWSEEKTTPLAGFELTQ
jgi:hypothetical protein